MNTLTLTRDTLRVHLNPAHKRRLQTLATRIAAVTGAKEASMPVLMRAAIHALEANAIAATKELSKGTKGIQCLRLDNWMRDAKHCEPSA
jgi:hypothetical protein